MPDDDDTGTTSSPWGRSRRPAGQPTPSPSDVAPPGAAPPGTPPSPVASTGSPPAADTAESWSPAPGGAPPGGAPPGGAPLGGAPPGGTPPPAYWPGAAPPPGYPSGGDPGGGPVPARKGRGGAVVAVVAVVALLVVSGAVAIIVLGRSGGDEPDRAADRTPSTVTEPPEPPLSITPGSTEQPRSTDAPPASSAPAATTTAPSTASSAPPDGFPEPPGAGTSVTGGIEVPDLTAEQVADFYEAELPGAGYMIDRVDEVTGVFVLTVSGPDQGVLSIAAFDPLPTIVLWSPA